MKKILGLILLVVSVNLFGQTPPGYQTRIVRERIQGSFMVDSTLHIPRYCGTPSGVRGGGSIQDGALAMDTCNNLLYIYSSGVWLALTSYNIYNSNGILSGNRTLTGLNNTYGLLFDSLNTFEIKRAGVSRLLMNNTGTNLYSPDGDNSVLVSNAVVQLSLPLNYLWVRSDSSLLHKRISYEGNLHSTFKTYSLVDKSYVDSMTSGGGGTPGGSNKQIQYNNSSSFAGAAGFEYGNTNNNVLITAQATTDVPLNIKGASSQTSHLLDISSYSGTGDLASIDKNGYGQFSRVGVGIAPDRPLYITTATSYGPTSSHGVVFESTSGLYMSALISAGFGANMTLSGGDASDRLWNFTTDANQGPGLRITNGGGNLAMLMQNNSGNPFVGINVDPARKLHVFENNSTTNAVTYIQRNTFNSTGTVANGFGGGTEWQLENASGTNRIAATGEIIYTDATNASEDADYVLSLIKAGTNTEAFRVLSTGQLKAAGYGSGTFTGTATKMLAVTSNGSVIEKSLTKSKATTIELPTAADTADMWQTPVDITISSLKTILRGASSPSVTFNLYFGSDITSPTNVFTSAITCTSVTTGCSNSSGFNDATIPAGSFIWIRTTAQSGTVHTISFTVNYTED